MKTQLDEFLSKITDFLKSEVKTETVVGQQFKLGEYICVPVIAFGMGLGTGEGEGESPKTGKGEGLGGGAGMGVAPLGFLVTKGDQISFISVRSNKGLTSLFEKAPELLDKYFSGKKKEKAEAMV